MADKKPERKFDKKFEKPFDKKPVAAKPGGGGLGAEIIVAIVLAVIILPLLGAFFSPGLRSDFLAMIATPLAYIKVVATIISMTALLIVVYCFLRILEIEGEEKKKLGKMLSWEHERTEKNERWERVEQYLHSENPSDWKIAILEADNILDDVVERMGYRGETLGERMKMIEASDFPHLDLAWKAHKLRNEIAHSAGADFVLSRTTVDQTVNIYHRIFKELGYL
ncbi:MAG: hypothetical protein Q7S52_00500 [bacterium]|nr:hypothetical protein [bacterium]